MNGVLRQLFEERSAVEPATVKHGERLNAVRRRIARTRRRMAAGAAAGLAVVLAVTATVGLRGGGSSRDPASGAATVTAAPTPSAASTEGFPRYVEGARILAAAAEELRPEASVDLRFEAPAAAQLAFFTRCDPAQTGMYVRIIWPAGSENMVKCDASVRWFDQKDLSRLGISAGQPTTVVFKAAPDRRVVEPASSGTLSVAVGERIPPGEAPLPPRPASLPPLPQPPADADLVSTIRNLPGDPLAPRTVQIGWAPHLLFFVLMQTPGDVHVQLNRREFMHCEKWDYSPPPSPPGYVNDCGEERILAETADTGKPGDTVTITVVPERVTGDWAVVVMKPAR